MNIENLELSNLLRERFLTGNGIKNTRELTDLAETTGLRAGQDFTNFKLLYDIAEFSLNQLLLDISTRCEITISLLDELSNFLPTETERSKDQSTYQQFSTPLSICLVMAKLLGLTKESTVIDPSAGTGNLVECARLCGVERLLVNELHPFRYELLRSGKYLSCTQEDALQLNNLIAFDPYRIDRVIMNPPFTRNVNKGSKVDLLAGANHLLAAYKRLAPNGRMVFVINGSFAGCNKGWKCFNARLGQHKVLANSILEDQSFKRKGTGFSTRLILIHKGWTDEVLFDQPNATLEELLNYSSILNQN